METSMESVSGKHLIFKIIESLIELRIAFNNNLNLVESIIEKF